MQWADRARSLLSTYSGLSRQRSHLESKPTNRKLDQRPTKVLGQLYSDIASKKPPLKNYAQKSNQEAIELWCSTIFDKVQ